MKEITAISIRVAGLVLVVFTLSKIPMYYLAYIAQLENSAIIYSLPILIPLLAGILLFKFPYTFRKSLINTNSAVQNNTETSEYLYIGIKLVGFIFLFYSISDIVFHTFNYIFIYNFADIEMSILNYDYPSVIATIVELLFSLTLILKTKDIISYITKHGV